MSTRSRARPWFAVSIEQHLLWDNPGSSLCAHGAFMAVGQRRGDACGDCMLELAGTSREEMLARAPADFVELFVRRARA